MVEDIKFHGTNNDHLWCYLNFIRGKGFLMKTFQSAQCHKIQSNQGETCCIHCLTIGFRLKMQVILIAQESISAVILLQ